MVLELFNIFFRNDFKIFLANTTEKAINILNTEKIDILITDFMMPNLSGLEFIHNVKKTFEISPICFLTSSNTDPDMIKEVCDNNTIFKFLEKPFNVKDVKQYVSDAYNQYKR
jgi:response regulator RpfG family c-di-GMP phosphodiesterase